MNQLGSKILETPRLLLRPFRASDAEQAFANWMSDSAVTRFLTWEPHSDLSFTRELLALWEEEAQSPETYHWAIVWKENGEAAGDISVVAADMRSESAAVGYCLSRALWGKGVMTEALSRVVEYSSARSAFTVSRRNTLRRTRLRAGSWRSAAFRKRACFAPRTVCSERASGSISPCAPSCAPNGNSAAQNKFTFRRK